MTFAYGINALMFKNLLILELKNPVESFMSKFSSFT